MNSSFWGDEVGHEMNVNLGEFKGEEGIFPIDRAILWRGRN